MDLQTLQIIEIVMGLITFGLSICAITPQIFAFHKTRNTSGVSVITLAAVCFDNILWLVWAYGFYFNSMLMYPEKMTRLFQISQIVLCFSYTFGSVLVFYTLLFKIGHVIKAKQLKVTELQLSKILLDKDKKKFFVDHKWNNPKRYLIPCLYIVLTTIITFVACGLLYVFAYIQPVEGTKEWVWVIVFSLLSSIIWEISCWPQFIKSLRIKDTSGLSLFWTVFTAANCVVTFVYDLTLAFNKGDFNWDILFVLIFSAMAPNIGEMIIKIKNMVNAKKHNMTELEYTKKFLLPQVKAKNKKKNSH